MTALIGGVCVGIIWGVWMTRKLIKRGKEIRAIMERNKRRNSKLLSIINQQNNGKETQKGQAAKTDGPDNAIR